MLKEKPPALPKCVFLRAMQCRVDVVQDFVQRHYMVYYMVQQSVPFEIMEFSQTCGSKDSRYLKTDVFTS